MASSKELILEELQSLESYLRNQGVGTYPGSPLNSIANIRDYLPGAVTEFREDELDAVMYSVDKWFQEGDPILRDNPATRAAHAREIALRAIEAAKEDRHEC